MLIGETIVDQVVDFLLGLAVRLAVEALAAFFFHGLPLIVQVFLGDGQGAHAVRLQVEAKIDLVLGQDLRVRGAVGVGVATHVAALGEDGVEVLAGAHVFGASEHHVLEQVREAGVARTLIAGADLVSDRDGVHGCEVVLGDNDAESVIERGIGELHRRHPGAGLLGERQPCKSQNYGCKWFQTTSFFISGGERPRSFLSYIPRWV